MLVFKARMLVIKTSRHKSRKIRKYNKKSGKRVIIKSQLEQELEIQLEKNSNLCKFPFESMLVIKTSRHVTKQLEIKTVNVISFCLIFHVLRSRILAKTRSVVEFHNHEIK